MADEQNKTTIKVAGMSCAHCVASVEKAAESVAGVSEVVVDLNAGTARVSGSFDRGEVVAAINAAGYEAS